MTNNTNTNITGRHFVVGKVTRKQVLGVNPRVVAAATPQGPHGPGKLFINTRYWLVMTPSEVEA